jgi:hypothetical protein
MDTTKDTRKNTEAAIRRRQTQKANNKFPVAFAVLLRRFLLNSKSRSVITCFFCLKRRESMAVVNISVDEDVKAQAEAVLAVFGLDLSTAINVFLKEVARRGAENDAGKAENGPGKNPGAAGREAGPAGRVESVQEWQSRARARVAAKFREMRAEQAVRVPVKAPRYDDIFFEAMAAMDEPEGPWATELLPG